MHALVIFGTRPEAIKMAPLVRELNRRRDRFSLSICSTGQHKEMLAPVLEAFLIEPHRDLEIMTLDQSLADITARVLESIDEVLVETSPDIVFVQGDTTSAMAATLASFYPHVHPFWHYAPGV